MNDSKLGITRENLLLIVPPALTHDPAMMARAAADAEALAARLAEIDREGSSNGKEARGFHQGNEQAQEQ